MVENNAAVGDRIQVTFKDSDRQLITRPGVVVRVWGPTTVNAVVWVDGTNDVLQAVSGSVWMTSLVYNTEKERQDHTWRHEGDPAPG